MSEGDTERDEWGVARKKPVEVEYQGPFHDTTTIETIEGDFEVDEEYLDEHGGYYLIRGVEGEVYPCAVEIFHATYEVVDGRSVDAETERSEEMVGTGRMNQTGGTATITMPKNALDLWELDENGLDVVWFTDGTRLFAVPKSEVRVQ